MQKIVGREIFEGKPGPEWTMHVHALGHGHKEISVSRSIWWEHSATMSDEAWSMYQAACMLNADDEQKKLANIERAARRAKTQSRRLCKVMGLDALLTLTYRENVQDLALCKRHLKEFVRRMRRLIPGFAYVAAFEQQKRGAWHVHMAIHALPLNLAWSGVKVKSYAVARAVWRSVVGDLGGNIDQSRRKRQTRSSPAKIAGYLSKYMLKSFATMGAEFERYSASKAEIPPPVRLRFMHEQLLNLMELAYHEAGLSGTITTPWLSPFGDRFFLVSEPEPPPKNGRSKGV
jgi:hypothetical protein